MLIYSVLFLFVASGAVNALIFSPYKDVGINLNWNTFVFSTSVTSANPNVIKPFLDALPASVNVATWAFAVGTCGSETWASIPGSKVAETNVKLWVAAGKKYIISTGGAAGSFKCASDADFETFINRYYSTSMIGVDFDIEGGMSPEDITSLVQRIQNAKAKYPSLRFSFTLATLSGDANPMLNVLGQNTMNAIQSVGLKDSFINLMVMDYGSTSPNNCVVVGNSCEMGLSAVRAAQNLHAQYGIPYDHIELTPMIGGNDAIDETFTLEDVTTVTNFALQNNLGGLHIWSFDRDTDCAPGYASPTCNTYGKGGTLGFTQKFASNLLQGPTPASLSSDTKKASISTPTDGERLWLVEAIRTCYATYSKDSCDEVVKAIANLHK